MSMLKITRKSNLFSGASTDWERCLQFRQLMISFENYLWMPMCENSARIGYIGIRRQIYSFDYFMILAFRFEKRAIRTAVSFCRTTVYNATRNQQRNINTDSSHLRRSSQLAK